MDDLISRQAAIDALWYERKKLDTFMDECIEKGYSALRAETKAERNRIEEDIYILNQLPSAQPEIIHCMDCRWWDKCGDCDNGYCMAAKHGYWSKHWEISIRRKYKGDFYCADAERRTDD